MFHLVPAYFEIQSGNNILITQVDRLKVQIVNCATNHQILLKNLNQLYSFNRKIRGTNKT